MDHKKGKQQPWYAGEHQEDLFYLLIAIFFIELIVGGIAFFYGIIHASPEQAGGPPVARFPWLAWALASLLSPVGLLLIVHLAGTWLSRALTREEGTASTEDDGIADKHLPEGMKRFYASVKHAPTIVVLVGILLLGAGLFFVEGAFTALISFGKILLPYIPWLAGCGAALLAFCFLVHALMVYRQRKMETEFAWRREVLEKTGLVLVDKQSVALPQDCEQQALIAPSGVDSMSRGMILDVPGKALPPGEEPKTNQQK